MSERGTSIEVEPDVAAFEDWYAQAYPRLARAMAVMFGNIETGREIADEAMLKAFSRWESNRHPARPDAWVFTVAINEGRKRWKRRRREADRFATAALNQPSIAALGEPDLDLWRAVAALPPRSREAIVLRYIADLTEEDVAEAMGIATGSASSLLVKARRALKHTLTEGQTHD